MPIKKPTVKKSVSKKPTTKKKVVDVSSPDYEPNYQWTPAPKSSEPSTNDVLMSMMQFMWKMNETQEKILVKLENIWKPQEEVDEAPAVIEQSSEVLFEAYWEFYPVGDHMMTIEAFGRYRTKAAAEAKIEEMKSMFTGQPYEKNWNKYFFKKFDIKEIVMRTREAKIA